MQSHHVFRLPVELLDTLTPRNLWNQSASENDTQQAPLPTPNPTPVASASKSCNICNAVNFLDVEEQRSHYRSDWHRYNVKTRLAGGDAVDEAAFGRLVDGLENSISGSESSSDEDDDDSDSDAVAALVSRTKHRRSSSPLDQVRAPAQTAVTWFHYPPSTQLGIYRALFPTGTTDYLAQLKEMRSLSAERTWTLFMVAGGHFAGAIVRFNQPEESEETTQGHKKKPKRPKPEMEVVKHKTFHRYTTRRKQGGSQGLNDNAKGNAKSAGAQLRRYGEQALRDDIRNLIADWQEDIDDCERIWIRASGTNRKIFMDYDGCAIAKGDQRLRTFPFPTRRPTQAELTRCLNELTKVKVSHLTEDALRAQDEAYIASLPKPRPVPAAAPKPQPEREKAPKLSKEEEALRDKWDRLLDMVRKGRVEPLKSFWEKQGESMGGIDVRIPEWAGERWDTLLQLASHCDQEEMVQWLLDSRADPTVSVSPHEGDSQEQSKSDRRTAYDLAHNRSVRDVFRRAAGDHPDWWDWFGAARIPSALSREMEDDREEKKKVRKKGLKERLKEREVKSKERASSAPSPEPSIPSPPPVQSLSGPQKLGGSSGAAEGVMGLTPEMRAKIERERRARAAEARLKNLTK
ncbi:hypothetical protein BDZ89DRAFT_979558 [Hymenopellis radicata]|nr:hypothetical protein BDZ89DRAFT_979558 [Hymenopellis radicata]